MSRRIELKRLGGVFITEETFPNKWHGRRRARLCASVTSRLFKLGRERQSCVAVFTKRKPNCPKFYEITGRTYSDGSVYVSLVNYRGSFLQGVSSALKQCYKEDYRYVRIEP